MKSEPPIQRDETLALIDAMLCGEISREDASVLKGRLRSSEEARILYVEYVDVHCEMLLHADHTDPVNTDSILSRQIGGPRSRIAAWTVAFAVGFAFIVLPSIWLVWENQNGPVELATEDRMETVEKQSAPVVAPELPVVATLANSMNAVWSDIADSPDLPLGAIWRVGEWIDLEAGTAAIILSNGVRCTADDPVLMQIDVDCNCVLDFGTVTFEVPENAKGFTVRTHGGSFVDFGTTFGVRAMTEGVSEVHVLQGVVEARADPAGTSKRMAMRLNSSGSARLDLTRNSLTPIPFVPGNFSRPLAFSSGVERFSAAIRYRWQAMKQVVPSESSEHPVWLCREQSGITLNGGLDVRSSDGSNENLAHNVANNTHTIPAGSRVDSYLVNFSHGQTEGLTVSGRIEFQSRIAGVLLSSDELNETDSIFCFPETSLEMNVESQADRGAAEKKDSVAIGGRDGRSLEFSLTAELLPHLDQIRILVYSREQ